MCIRDRAWGAWLWAGADLLVAASAQMPYAHFLVVSVVPVTVALFLSLIHI